MSFCSFAKEQLLTTLLVGLVFRPSSLVGTVREGDCPTLEAMDCCSAEPPGEGVRFEANTRVCIKVCTQSREYSGNSDSGRPGALLILL